MHLFGQHQFSVNTQSLALTIVDREDGLYLHLTGTNFFERIDDPRIAETEPVWNQNLVSENGKVYRAEFLAHRQIEALRREPAALEKAMEAKEKDRMEIVRAFMAPRYAEGYVKGVHDTDAAKVLSALLDMESNIGMLRYPSKARALAMLAGKQLENPWKKHDNIPL